MNNFVGAGGAAYMSKSNEWETPHELFNELDAPPNEPNLGLVVDVLVEIPCVGPCWDESNNHLGSAIRHRLMALFDPFGNVPSIRRIAEHTLVSP